jgi:hypothetical protein
MGWSSGAPSLSADLIETFEYWREIVEDILGSSSTCKTELTFWVEAMGFKRDVSSGRLWIPAASYSTATSLWGHIEGYWQEQSVAYQAYVLGKLGAYYAFVSPSSGAVLHNIYYLKDGGKYNNYSFPGLDHLRQRHSFPARTLFDVLDDLYDRVSDALQADDAYLVANISRYDQEFVVGGLLVLFDYFVSWSAVSTDGGNFYIYLPPSIGAGELFVSASHVVGPYTTYVYYCENGVVRISGITHPEMPEYSICHQSVDADILLQDEVQVELTASQLLGAKVPSELDADEVLQARVDTELSAELPLRGEVQLTPVARLALWDTVPTSFDADEWLAATHQFPLDAYERLAAIPRIPLDADICIQGPVPISITARMYLEPDFKSEMLTDLERLHIQKYRIVADPRSYVEYNSEKDVEVVP